jgi:hypothetical protein
MAATYTPIASITLGADAASVTFSSIPQTYTDLVLIMNGYTASDYVYYQLNGDTAANYSRTHLFGNGSTATSNRLTGQGALFSAIGVIASPGQGISHIMNYANTTTNKTVLNRGNYASGYVGMQVGLWRSTAAITSIQIFEGGSGNLVAGTTFDLYGILGANA